MEMYQFLEANEAAAGNSDKPTRQIVGAIDSGPMNRNTKPISPLKPRNT